MDYFGERFADLYAKNLNIGLMGEKSHSKMEYCMLFCGHLIFFKISFFKIFIQA